MRLNQFKKYHWVDTPRLVEEHTGQLLEALRNDSETETEAEHRLNEIMTMSDIAPPEILPIEPDAAIYGLTPETSKYELTQERIDELKISWGPDYNEEEYL